MTALIDAVNEDFRATLEAYNTPEHPAREIVQWCNEQFIERGAYLIGKKPFPVFLKPVFIDACRLEEITRGTNAVISALEKLTDLYFTEPEVRDLFELKPEEVELAEIDPGYPRKIRITRNDAFLTDTFFKMIEFNCDSPGGPMYTDILTDIINETPIMQEIHRRYEITQDRFVPAVLRTLLSAYRDFGGKKEKPYIALVAGDQSATLPEFQAIARWLRERGYGSSFADPRWLEFDGQHVRTPEGEIIDIIYRRGWLPDWTAHMDEIKPLIAGYRAGAVCVVNSPRSILGANKHVFQLLQDERFQRLFNDEERRAIRENLPWTRLMREEKTTRGDQTVDLYEFVHANKDKLVLKPMDMLGGKDVCVGPFATQSQWDSWIEKTTQHKFVVQDYVPIPEELFPVVEEDLAWRPKKVNMNFFAYDGVYSGGLVRASESAVINVSAGGGQATIGIVHRKR
jgi:uncharacterized circularly permuted ATP-grasp superfamily protein